MKNDRITVQELLKELGFAETDAETYWALLNLETVSIRRVAQQSGINRGTTYEAIKRLQVAGLVSARRSGQREYYSAESPERIFDLIRDKRKELWHAQEFARQLVPELLARKAQPQGRPLVKYHEDDEGVVTILRDVLRTCAKLDIQEYRVYSSRPMRQYLYRKFPEFTERRIREGIAVKVIAVGEGGEPAEVSQRKWIREPNEGGLSSYTIIYGDKIASISMSSDYAPYGVVIEDSGAAAMQKLLFDQLWRAL